MLAVHIRAGIQAEEDTVLDPRPMIRRSFTVTPRVIDIPQKPVKKAAPMPVEARRPSLAPVAGRLSSVRVEESIGRRQSSGIAKRSATIAPMSRPRVQISWARSNDATQSVRMDGTDAFIIRGAAAGRTPILNRPPSCGFAGSTASVGVDGMSYTVRFSGGESAGESVRRLVERLGQRFILEVQRLDDGGVRVRLVDERYARG